MERAYKFSSFYVELKTNGYSDKVTDRVLWEVPHGSKTWAERQKKNKCRRVTQDSVESFAEKGYRHVAW